MRCDHDGDLCSQIRPAPCGRPERSMKLRTRSLQRLSVKWLQNSYSFGVNFMHDFRLAGPIIRPPALVPTRFSDRMCCLPVALCTDATHRVGSKAPSALSLDLSLGPNCNEKLLIYEYVS